MMTGLAAFNVKQTGLDKQPAVTEKLATLVCDREGINAQLTASIAMEEKSPGELLMPNRSLLYTGRVLACSELHDMMYLAGELCRGRICVSPDHAAFVDTDTKSWVDKLYSVNKNWMAEHRRKLLALVRDLLNNDYVSHKLTLALSAQYPLFAHLNAVYNNFDFAGPMEFAEHSARLSDRVMVAKEKEEAT